MTDDRRLIEDYLPIEEISAEASSEPRTKGHISTLHLWRARRPLVACRAAVFGALIPQSQFHSSEGIPGKDKELGRANARTFVKELCKYPAPALAVQKASRLILEAHARRLSEVAGRAISESDIIAGRAPRPRVLDMFAGGGAIPLEAARLGCETYAIELNPVAYLIELCTVTFPQEFGTTLADDVESWGRKVLDAVERDVSDLFGHSPKKPKLTAGQKNLAYATSGREIKDENLSIVAYYWTRTAPGVRHL